MVDQKGQQRGDHVLKTNKSGTVTGFLYHFINLMLGGAVSSIVNLELGKAIVQLAFAAWFWAYVVYPWTRVPAISWIQMLGHPGRAPSLLLKFLLAPSAIEALIILVALLIMTRLIGWIKWRP